MPGSYVSIRNSAFRVTITTALVISSILFFSASAFSFQQDLLGVAFPTDTDGWACGRWGQILHTADGGKTWNSQTSGTEVTLSNVNFIDSKNGWIVGDQGLIIHTKDGGVNWIKQTSPVPYYLMDVEFVSPSKGWIVTEKTTIIATDNGGETWQVQFKDEDFILKSVSFCDEQNGWVAGEYGFTYHTNNGGKTWQHQAGEYMLDMETMSMKGGNFLFDVVAINPKTAWVAGIGGYLARTDDGGQSWTQIKEGIPKRHLFSLAKDMKGNVIISGDALLIRNQQGTSTFFDIEISPAITYGWLYRIANRGSSGFVAVGKQGWIYASNSQGTSWQKVRY